VIVRRQRTVPAAPGEVWGVVSDPARLPQWWPGVSRVEEASREAWTKVLTSAKGTTVRADYTRLDAEEPRRLRWRHEVEASPFERILAQSTTEIELEPENGKTRVEIAIRQQARGWARLSPFQLRAAATRQAEGALDGLERLLGRREAA
jgi:uncharacterized protein YndB with AHSA1/START domain